MAHHLEEDLPRWAAPILDELGLFVYDVEVGSGKVRLVVDRPGGVGLDEIARCTRALSPILDEQDPMSGRYTLEVSSPGLERKLRTVEHRRGAVGETIKCKFRSPEGETKRAQGTLQEVTEGELVIDTSDGLCRVPHGDVLSAQTVFVWPNQAGSAERSRAKRPQTARKVTP